jgi:hypothetical protein
MSLDANLVEDSSNRNDVLRGDLEVDLEKSIAERRTRRTIVKPRRYRDELPVALPALPPEGLMASAEASTSGSQDQPRNGDRGNPYISTSANIFGLFRRYLGKKLPDHDPEENFTLQQLCTTSSEDPSVPESTITHNKLHPYPNFSSFLLGDWYWNQGVQKSQENFLKLLKIIGRKEFRSEDICKTKWKYINNVLGNLGAEEGADSIDYDEGWSKTSITIPVPFHRLTDSPGIADYIISAFHHRSIVSTIRERLESPVHHKYFHYEPFELLWSRSGAVTVGDSIQVYGELYSSKAFRDAHQLLQCSPREPGCDLPRYVAALMFWSDVTHLTAFSNTKLWPLYLFFGNESKYRRAKPSYQLCEHIAYFEQVSIKHFAPSSSIKTVLLQLPESFKDFAIGHAGKRGYEDSLLAHLRRELFHLQWLHILDDEFMEAFEHGVPILCADGIKRRIYPRIFTYSADYPEK